MKFLLSTGSVYPKPKSEAFRLANKLEFDGVELLIDNHVTPEECEKLNEEYSNVKSIHMHFFPWKWPETNRYIEIFKPKNIVVHPTPPKTYLLWTLKKLNIPRECITIETLESWKNFRHLAIHPYCFIWSLKGYLNFVKKHNFSLTIDTSHIFTYKTSPIKTINMLKHKIKNVHVSDCNEDRLHLPIGKGKFPFDEFMKLTKNVKFITLELTRANNQEIRESFEKIKSLL